VAASGSRVAPSTMSPTIAVSLAKAHENDPHRARIPLTEKFQKNPRKSPRQERSRATVDAIIEASARIIEEEGLARLNTNRVARVAGVSVGSLYQYFPHKEALVEQVASKLRERFTAGFLEWIGQLRTLEPRAAIRALVVLLVRLHAESPGVHHAIGTGSPADAQKVLHVVVGNYLETHAAQVRRPDRTRAALVLLDTAESLVHTTSLRAPELLQDPAWLEEVCDLLERYVLEG